MEITTTCRRFKLTPDLRDHAEKRISKLSRYLDSIQEAHLVLAQEKYRQLAELSIHASGTDFVSREETPDMMASIDRVVDRMERQIKKRNTRLKARKTARVIDVTTVVDEEELPEVEPVEEFSPVVVRSHQIAPEAITVEDAIRLMRDKDWDFVLFHNSRSGRTALVHMRDDGNYGLVETPD